MAMVGFIPLNHISRSLRLCASAVKKGFAVFSMFSVLGFLPARAEVTFLDLSKAANMGPNQPFDGEAPGVGDLKEKEGFANIPQGPQTLRGIPFQLLDWTANAGKSFIALRGKSKADFPQALSLPAGHLKAQSLYFLHSCRWGGTDPKVTVAEYDVIYDDGQVAVIPLHVGAELANFSGADDTPSSSLAWWHKYKNIDMGLSLFAWENPRPEAFIQAILFKSENKKPVPLLFAITASDRPLTVSAVSPKPEKTFRTDTQGWIPFEPSNATLSGTAIDMGSLLDAPAGKHGRVKAQGDDLVFEDGTPARFWGVNLGEDWEHWGPGELQDRVERLASYGCNLAEVRLPEGVSEAGPLLEKMKAKGIYVVLDGLAPLPRSSPAAAPAASQDDPALVPADLVRWPAPGTGLVPADEKEIAFRDDPEITHPETSFLASLVSSRVFGKPYVPSWKTGWPNEFIAWAPLMASAYGSFEGWAGLVGGSLQGGDWGGELAPDEGLDDKPSLRVQWPVAALCFLRDDLKEGRIYVLPPADSAGSLAGLAHRSGLQPEGGKFKTDPAGSLKAKVAAKNLSIVSDTAQIHWQGNVGLVQVSSPRFQALIGFVGEQKLASPVWQVESSNLFASLSLISLTKTNLWASDHMLLTGVTRMENSGQVYNAAKTKLISMGKSPILLEPLKAKITLFRYKPDPDLRARALDANGQVLPVKVPLKWARNNLVFSWVPSAFYVELFRKKK